MRNNYKYAEACQNNAVYSRGDTGISIVGKRALGNLCQKAGIEVKQIYGEYNGYSYPVIDKTITKKDIDILKTYAEKNTVTAKEKEQLNHYSVNPEDTIHNQAVDWLDKNYPDRPDGILLHIEEQWQKNGRKISSEMLNRLPMLLRSHIRHAYTDYHNYNCASSDRRYMRQNFNAEASKILEGWRGNNTNLKNEKTEKKIEKHGKSESHAM